MDYPHFPCTGIHISILSTSASLSPERTTMEEATAMEEAVENTPIEMIPERDDLKGEFF